MSENARVWKVYQDEATIQDDALLDAWNKTLDILLIFVGYAAPRLIPTNRTPGGIIFGSHYRVHYRVVSASSA